MAAATASSRRLFLPWLNPSVDRREMAAYSAALGMPTTVDLDLIWHGMLRGMNRFLHEGINDHALNWHNRGERAKNDR